MGNVNIVRDVSENFNGSAVLVELDNSYFVVSSVDTAFDTGLPETLAFEADDEGNVVSYLDVAGGVNQTREDVIRQLEENGPRDESWVLEDPERPEDTKDPFTMLSSILDYYS